MAALGGEGFWRVVLETVMGKVGLNGLDEAGIEFQKRSDGPQHLGVIDRLVFMNQPVAEARRRSQQVGKLRRDDPEFACLEEAPIIILRDLGSELRNQMCVDVEGSLDDFLE
jgi:hypothetical protein